MASGAGATSPRAPRIRSRPSSTSAWFAAMTSGQPAGSLAGHPVDRRWEASATAVGSAVPIQSNSSWNRGRSRRGSLAPCETVVGRMASRRSARTHRNAVPFGAHSHLWPLPV